ncbi:MAG TPA: ABC transporter substrate-binding protein [Geobacteraceae bacterium]
MLTLTLAFSLLVVMSLPAHSADKLIAAVLTSDLPRYHDAHRAFVKALAQRGYDQNNTEIIVQSPNPDPISWANSIRKFKAIGANVIVTYGAPVTLAALRESPEVPVLFVDVYGPVETGISRSMSMTGRNFTGISSKVPMATLIRTYQEIRPIRTLGIVYNSREVGSVVQLKEIKRIAAQQGFAVVEANVPSPATLDGAINSLLRQVDCLFVSEGSTGSRALDKIVHRASATKVPVISLIPDASDRGALVALEANPVEQGQMAGDYAVRILSGRKPAQMPIGTPRKVELIINLKAAKLLDLSVPFQALSAASRLIK